MKYLKYLINYILSFFIDFYYFLFGDIRSRICGPAYYRASKLYPDYLKQGNMAESVLCLAAQYCNGKGLDVGAGKWPLAGARAIENSADENAYTIKEANNSVDFVFSSHALEHLQKWQDALREWHRVLKPSGAMFLYLPHPVCKMWTAGVNKQHLWTPDSNIVSKFLNLNLKMKIERITYTPDALLSFVVIARK